MHVHTGGNALRLYLPELRRMELHWRHWPAGGNHQNQLLDEETFKHTNKLEMLSLGNTPLADDPASVVLAQQCLLPLTALKDLTLANCGLDGVPSAVTALSASLTYLNLPENLGFEVSRKDVDLLLHLRHLRKLDVHKSDFDDDTPEHWSTSSIQALIDLPGRFLAQLGVIPAVVVFAP